MTNSLRDSLPPAATAPVPQELTAHRSSLNALTGIRFLAAFYVVLYHSHMSQALSEAGLKAEGNFIANGDLAVLLFFLLSGFILSYTYRGQIERRGDVRRFWEARFARVWPLYFVSLMLSTVATHTTPPPAQALATLFMVQAWNPLDIGMAGSWNFVCWTLSTEALFYLVFPFLQLWLERRSERVQVVSMVVMIVVSIAFGTSLHVFGFPVHAGFAYTPLAVVRVPEFVIGVCLGNLFLSRRTRLRQSVPVTSWLARTGGPWTWVAALASVALLCQQPGWIVTLTVATFAALLFGLAAERSLLQRFLSTPWMLVGGQISYGMYLLQWPCKMEVNRVCNLLHIASMPLRLVLYVVVLIALSVACFYLVENPARRLIRYGFVRIEAFRRSPAPVEA
jgi:peptidoglycan/LPS O-acetylase OafA/YrhL